MSREKQIEEMAKITANAIEEMVCKKCEDCRWNGSGSKDADCTDYVCAEALYNAGYRKQSEGEWIDQHNGKYDNPIYVCSLCRKGTLLKPDIDELGNMKMIQALSTFCPNCGAKMKGGGE